MRITAEHVIQHKYFNDLHDPDDEPVFEGSIDFTFEKDKKLSLEKIQVMIIDEINYFKKLYNEKLLKKKKMLRQWRQYKLLIGGDKIEVEKEVEKKAF